MKPTAIKGDKGALGDESGMNRPEKKTIQEATNFLAGEGDSAVWQVGHYIVDIEATLFRPKAIEFFDEKNEHGEDGIVWMRNGHGVGFVREKIAFTQSGYRGEEGKANYELRMSGRFYEPKVTP